MSDYNDADERNDNSGRTWPPADQPADHIGEGDEAAAVKLLESRCRAIDKHYERFPNSLDRTMEKTAKAIRAALSIIARQQETIRADGECLTEIADPASPWDSTGEPLAYRISMDLTRRTELARARLSAHQPKEPK